MNLIPYISVFSLLGILLYLLLVPVHLSFSFHRDKTSAKEIKLRFFPFRIKLGGKGPKTTAVAKGKKPGREKKKPVRWTLVKDFHTFYQTGWLCLRFLRGIARARYHYLRISIQGGLGAPDITGVVAGIVEAVKPACGGKIAIKCRPDFNANRIQGRIRIETVFRIYIVLIETARLIYLLPKRKLFHLYRTLS